jgi:hypothetical protein
VSRHPRTRVVLVLIAALVLVAAAAAACSAPASGGAPEGGAEGDASAGSGAATGTASVGGAKAADARGGANADWSRVAQALAAMRAQVPSQPIVVLLGGSAARESTIDDGSWRDQILAKGGPAVLAWNMGSRNRTMAQNLAIVKKLPPGVHAIVVIGVNLGSFTSTQRRAVVTLPSPAPAVADVGLEQPHQYNVAKTGILSASKKKTLVRQWLSDRYPVYKANFGLNATLLENLVKLCRERGYKPVLLELPRNSKVIGSSLSAPTARYRDTCKRLAARYRITWVPQLASLSNQAFYDLWHLVEPGRKVWQERLSAKSASLLELYGFDGGGP